MNCTKLVQSKNENKYLSTCHTEPSIVSNYAEACTRNMGTTRRYTYTHTCIYILSDRSHKHFQIISPIKPGALKSNLQCSFTKMQEQYF